MIHTGGGIHRARSSWDEACPPVEIARRAESGMVPIIIWMYEWVCMVHSHSGSAPVTLRWYELVYPSGGVLVDAMSVLPATPVALGTTPS